MWTIFRAISGQRSPKAFLPCLATRKEAIRHDRIRATDNSSPQISPCMSATASESSAGESAENPLEENPPPPTRDPGLPEMDDFGMEAAGMALVILADILEK